VTRKELIEAYLDDLRLALDDINLLLNSINADRAVITADHGECFGEYGLYGHHGWTPVPELVQVPWVITSAEDTSGYEPKKDLKLRPHANHEDTDRKLSALGYKT
jgi:glucan phosphoethanolaminetransferase (alkaline phosphatase superfamily)